MNRRSFLKALAALAGGVALRPVPVLGQSYSGLVPLEVFPSAGVDEKSSIDSLTLEGFWNDADSNLYSSTEPTVMYSGKQRKLSVVYFYGEPYVFASEREPWNDRL